MLSRCSSVPSNPSRGVLNNRGTPSQMIHFERWDFPLNHPFIFIGFSTVNQPFFWGYPHFSMEHHGSQESIELSAPAKRGQNPLDVVYESLGEKMGAPPGVFGRPRHAKAQEIMDNEFFRKARI